MSVPRPSSWMPLYWGDYLRDTTHLTAAQHGAYFLLIGWYWTNARPPADDDGQLSRIARMDAAEWTANRPVVARLFQVCDGVWRHKRIEHELAVAQAKYQQRFDHAARTIRGNRPDELREAARRNSRPKFGTEYRNRESEPRIATQSQSQSQQQPPSGGQGARLRGSRIPPEWLPSVVDVEFAAQQGLSQAAITTEADKFRDYYKGAAGANGIRTDWSATWRNWIRKAQQMGTGRKANREGGLEPEARRRAIAKALGLNRQGDE